MLTKLDRADGITVLKYGLFLTYSVPCSGNFWSQKWKCDVS